MPFESLGPLKFDCGTCDIEISDRRRTRNLGVVLSPSSAMFQRPTRGPQWQGLAFGDYMELVNCFCTASYFWSHESANLMQVGDLMEHIYDLEPGRSGQPSHVWQCYGEIAWTAEFATLM